MISFSDIAIYYASRFKDDAEFSNYGLEFFANEDYEALGGSLNNYLNVMCMNSNIDTQTESYNIVIECVKKREYDQNTPKRENVAGLSVDSSIKTTDLMIKDVVKRAKEFTYDGIEANNRLETGFSITDMNIARPLTGNSQDIFVSIMFTIERKKCKGDAL